MSSVVHSAQYPFYLPHKCVKLGMTSHQKTIKVKLLIYLTYFNRIQRMTNEHRTDAAETTGNEILERIGLAVGGHFENVLD